MAKRIIKCSKCGHPYIRATAKQLWTFVNLGFGPNKKKQAELAKAENVSRAAISQRLRRLKKNNPRELLEGLSDLMR